MQILQINKVPVSVNAHDWKHSVHPSEELFGYCIVNDLHQAKIHQSRLQLFSDKSLLSESIKIYLGAMNSDSDGLFYMSSPAGEGLFKFIGRPL